MKIKKTINLQLTRPARQQLPQYVWFPSYCHVLACKPHCIPQEEQVFWEATLGDLADKLRIGVHSRYALYLFFLFVIYLNSQIIVLVHMKNNQISCGRHLFCK